MTHAEKVRKAADALQQYGCIAGTFGNTSKGFCALGALDYAGKGSFYATAEAVDRVLDLPRVPDKYNGETWLKHGDGRLAAWFNNLVDAGKCDEAIAGLRQAADLLEQEPSEE